MEGERMGGDVMRAANAVNVRDSVSVSVNVTEKAEWYSLSQAGLVIMRHRPWESGCGGREVA